LADTKVSALTELAATPAGGDELYIRDISEAAADESKRITVDNLLGGVLKNIIEDTTPQLGGSLDANNNTILNIVNAYSDLTSGVWTAAVAGQMLMLLDSYSTGATSGPTLLLDHSNSDVLGTQTAVDAADELGAIMFRGSNGTGFVNGGQFLALATETFSGSARGTKLEWKTVDNTTTTLDLRMTLDQDGGLYMAGATGSSQGVGTINAVGVYDDSVLLTCYVAEAFNTGRINLQEWDDLVPNRIHEPVINDGVVVEPGGTEVRQHDSARRFSSRIATDLDPKLYGEFMLANGNLPAMPSKVEWAVKRLGMGDLTQRLWETCEVQAIHILKLEQRITALGG